MHRIDELAGGEHDLGVVSRAIGGLVRSERPAGVGALLVTCSDESEQECADAFDRNFADEALPHLKAWHGTAFRTANLGGRYEWGSVGIADDHFATAAASEGVKLMVVKINAHVGVDGVAGDERYGIVQRYGRESIACGGLGALLTNAPLPVVAELAEVFGSEEKDRLAVLRDPQQVDPQFRPLLAAVVGARLQARRALLDIQQLRPLSPTLFVVLGCVTLNRQKHDTELFVGAYRVDATGDTTDVRYNGLGDDPGRYEVSSEGGRLRITDDQLHQERTARDHRHLVFEQWQRRRSEAEDTGQDGPEEDMRLERFRQLVADKKHHNKAVATAATVAVLGILAGLAPVPTALLLFADGLCGIHHVYAAHRLAHAKANPGDADLILAETRHRIENDPNVDAGKILERLVGHHGNVTT